MLCYDGRLVNELRAAGARTHLIGAARRSRPWLTSVAQWRLRRVLRESAIDLVVHHSLWPAALFGRTCARSGVRSVLWIHGRFDPSHWTARLAMRARPERVVAVSIDTLSQVRSWQPNLPARTIYAPFPRVMGATGATRAEIRRELATPEDHKVIIQVSRIEEGKGHAVHLTALGDLMDRGDWTAWIVGGAQRPAEQALMDRLRSMVRGLGIEQRVRFVGERSDVADVLRAADIFCQPNTHPEGLGLVFLEAACCNLPVVTSAIGGIVEILDDRCAVLLPPRGTAEVAAALRRLIESDSLRRTLGQSGQHRVRALCDPAIQMAKLANYFLLREDTPAADDLQHGWNASA